MKSILITGHTGFVGQNLVSNFSQLYNLSFYERNSNIMISQDVVIHLAAKSQDLKKVKNPTSYYEVNLGLTKKVFDQFLNSDAKTFIMFSSVKAVADRIDEALTEDTIPNPLTDYGKSKLEAEKYILSKELQTGKKLYILRPCLIHGPGNDGNLSLLTKIVSKQIPWPLGSFSNQRSYCSIDNLMFILRELIDGVNIPSGIYNVADSMPISTNELVEIIAKSSNVKPRIWKVPKFIINSIAKLGDLVHLPLNSERLQKLTENYVVISEKIIQAIGKELPSNTIEGFHKTFRGKY